MKALILTLSGIGACVLFCILFCTPAYAQIAGIVQFDEQIYVQGSNTVTGTPGWTATYPAALATCNQVVPLVPPIVINPGRVAVDDPNNLGRACIILAALPAILPSGIGYIATITQTDTFGQVSPRSAASNPFNKQPLAPTALTGLKRF